MSLPRIMMASRTLDAYNQLSYAKRKILAYLMTRRSMRDRPIRPTAYLSYKEIALHTDLTEKTVRVLTGQLKKTDGWWNFHERKRITACDLSGI